MADMPTQRIAFDSSTGGSAILKPQSVPAQALWWGWEAAEVVVLNETLEELRQCQAPTAAG